MGFPQFGNIDKVLIDTIKGRAGNNKRVSRYIPWIRVISCLEGFLVLESSKEATSFTEKYGNSSKPGSIGRDGKGKPIYVDGDRGFRPSPTIDSLSVKQGNEGLSKKTTFTITCYSLGQCEKLMEYFMEPGNMVFVEWGFNLNSSVGTKVAPIEPCKIAAFHSNIHLQTKRKSSGGTYDAILGTITGGDMSYGDNETFSLNVELTSVGDLPAYLQHHKGVADDSSKDDKSSKVFDVKEIDSEAEENVGKTLFMQMYNDLPGNKRTTAVKNLIKEEWATNASNFINFDTEIREKFTESLKGKQLHQEGSDGEDIEINSDTPLFSSKRFLRVALAFEILDKQSSIEMAGKEVCPGVGAPKTKVIWKNTICRAFKNMYSADSNFLYIPNKFAPSFDILEALSSSDKITSPLPDFPDSGRELPVNKTADLHPNEYGGTRGSYFPNNNALDFSGLAQYDGTYVPLKANAGNWGYLRDLYINFDFFCQTIQGSSGMVTKDVYYKLLNGMSGAVNLLWNFQIVPSSNIPTHSSGVADAWYNFEKGRDTKDTLDSLQIVDMGFCGDQKQMESVGKARFQSRGVNSPFLSADLKFDIPGAMKGQIIGQKSKGAPDNPNPDQKEIVIKGLFASKKDVVLEKLNAMVKKKEDAEEDAPVDTERTEEEKKEQKIANYEYFVGNAIVVPKIQDREELESMDFIDDGWWDGDYGGGQFSDLLVVGGWDDQALLKKVQLFNEGVLTGSKVTVEEERQSFNPPLLPIEFNFSIHGVSGLRVGDTFSISDLPGKYKKKVFQITSVEHDIQQNIWVVNVTGKLRNMNIGEAQ